MHWKSKAHALAVLSRIPAGKSIYGILQRTFGTNRLDTNEYLSRALEIVALIRERGRDLSGGTYLEIGTGWRPFAPFLLYLLGAERIITIDINPWLNRRYALETYRALANRLTEIARQLGLDPDLIQRRYKATVPHCNSLRELLRSFRVEYRCPADARDTWLPGQSIDYVFSSNVLEHIPPSTLLEIHSESLRILKPDGLAIHRFNPGDHFSLVDKSITGVNFLRYSGQEWSRYGGMGLAYHNRLRCVQHRRLFEKAGFTILVDRVRIDDRSLHAISQQELRIHSDFAEFTPEELAADYMWIVCSPRDPKPPSRLEITDPRIQTLAPQTTSPSCLRANHHQSTPLSIASRGP